MLRGAVGLLVAAAFVAALVLATRREVSVLCTVCMEYAGQTACRSAAGADRESAARGAAGAACSILASGVTRGLECDRTPPRSIECGD